MAIPSVEELYRYLAKDPERVPFTGDKRKKALFQLATQEARQQRNNRRALDLLIDKAAPNQRTTPERSAKEGGKPVEAKRRNRFDLDIIQEFDINDLQWGQPSRNQGKQMQRPIKTMDLDVADLALPPFTANDSPETYQELLEVQEMGLLRDVRQDDINSQQTKEGLLREFKKYADEHHFITNWDFVRMVMDDINTLVLSLKFAFNRPRPDTLAQHQGILLSVEGDGTYHTPSYPSYHSTASRVVAEVIAGTYVGHKTELLRIADKIGMNRVIAGYHYMSDHQAGLLLANQLILKITTNLSINPVYEREETIDSKTAETVTENFMDTLEEVHRRGEAVTKEEEGDYEDSYMAAVKMAIGRHADETAFMTDVNKADLKKIRVDLGDIKYDEKTTNSPLLRELGNTHDAALVGAISAFSVSGDLKKELEGLEDGDIILVTPHRDTTKYLGMKNLGGKTGEEGKRTYGSWEIRIKGIRPLSEVSPEEDELNEGRHDYDDRVASEAIKIDFEPVISSHFGKSLDEFLQQWNVNHPDLVQFADPLGITEFGVHDENEAGTGQRRHKHVPKGHKYNPDDDYVWNEVRAYFGTLDRPTKALDEGANRNIYTDSPTPLMAALTNFNSLSVKKGTLSAGTVGKFHFSMDNFDDLIQGRRTFISSLGSAERSRYPHENVNYGDSEPTKRTPKGKLYADVEEALGDIAGIGHYQGLDENGNKVDYHNAPQKPGWDAARLEKLNVELIKAKLQANTGLHKAIQDYGGLDFIKSLSHNGARNRNDGTTRPAGTAYIPKLGWFSGGMWEGDGISSAMIRALGKAYHGIQVPQVQINRRIQNSSGDELPSLYSDAFVEEILQNPQFHYSPVSGHKHPQSTLDEFLLEDTPTSKSGLVNFTSESKYNYDSENGKARNPLLSTIKSTYAAILAGDGSLRTTTTRPSSIWGNVKEGSKIPVIDPDDSTKRIYIEIMKITPTHKVEGGAEGWSLGDGWHKDEFERYNTPGKYNTFQFRVIKDANYHEAKQKVDASDEGRLIRKVLDTLHPPQNPTIPSSPIAPEQEGDQITNATPFTTLRDLSFTGEKDPDAPAFITSAPKFIGETPEEANKYMEKVGVIVSEDWKKSNPPKQHVFVFGSNELGIHGKGGAEKAALMHGAIAGEGRGLTGNFAYALPTKRVPSWEGMEKRSPERKAQLEKYVQDYNDKFFESPNFTPLTVDELIAKQHKKQFSPEELQKNVNEFVKFMGENPEMVFHITDLGTQDAGYTKEEMSNAFKTALGNSSARDNLRQRVASGDIMFGPKLSPLVIGNNYPHDPEAFDTYPHWDAETETFDPTGGGAVETGEQPLGPRDVRINTGFAGGADTWFKDGAIANASRYDTTQHVVGHSFKDDTSFGIPKDGKYASNVKRQIHSDDVLMDQEHEDKYREAQAWMRDNGKPNAGKNDKWEKTPAILLKSRNYEQVRNSDAVLGVIEGLPVRWKDSDKSIQTGRIPVSQGGNISGSAYAVVMGILKGIPVYVYDQRAGSEGSEWTAEGERGGWLEWDYGTGDWSEITVPPFYQRIAGIGSRQINEASSGYKAIQAWLSGMGDMQNDESKPPFAPPRVWDDSEEKWVFDSEEDEKIHQEVYGDPYIQERGDFFPIEFMDMDSFPNFTNRTLLGLSDEELERINPEDKKLEQLIDQPDKEPALEPSRKTRGEVLNVTDKKSFFERFPEMKTYREDRTNPNTIYDQLASNPQLKDEIEAAENKVELSILTDKDQVSYLKKIAIQISETRKKEINKEIDEMIAVFKKPVETPVDPAAIKVVKEVARQADNEITASSAEDEDSPEVRTKTSEELTQEREEGIKAAIAADTTDNWRDFLLNPSKREAWGRLKGNSGDNITEKEFIKAFDLDMVKVHPPEDFDTIRSAPPDSEDDTLVQKTPRTVESEAPEAVPKGTGGHGWQAREKSEEGVVEGGMEDQSGREFDPEELSSEIWEILNTIVPDDGSTARGFVFAPLWSGYASKEFRGRNYDIRANINRFFGFDASGIYDRELGQAISPNTDTPRMSLFNQLRDEVGDYKTGVGSMVDYVDLLGWLNDWSPEIESSGPGGFNSDQGYLDTREHIQNEAAVTKEKEEAKAVKKFVERDRSREEREEYNTGSQVVEAFLRNLSPEGHAQFMSLSEEDREAIKRTVFPSVSPDEVKDGISSGWNFKLDFPMGQPEHDFLENLTDAWARMLPEFREVKMKPWFDSCSSASGSLTPKDRDNFRTALGLFTSIPNEEPPEDSPYETLETPRTEQKLPVGNKVIEKGVETGEYYPFNSDPGFVFLDFFLKLNDGRGKKDAQRKNTIQADNLLKVLDTTDKKGKVTKARSTTANFMKLPGALNILIDDVYEAYLSFKETGKGKPKYLNFAFGETDDAQIEHLQNGLPNPRYNPNRIIKNQDIKTILHEHDYFQTNAHLIHRLLKLGQHKAQIYGDLRDYVPTGDELLLARQWESLTGVPHIKKALGYPKKGGMATRNAEFFKRMLTLHIGQVEGEDGVRFKGIQDIISTIYDAYPNVKDQYNPHLDSPMSPEDHLKEQREAEAAEPKTPMAGTMSTAGTRPQPNPFAAEAEDAETPSVFQRTMPVVNNEVFDPSLTGEDLFKRFIITISSAIDNLDDPNAVDERVAMQRLGASVVGHSDTLRQRLDRDFPDDTADLGTIDELGNNVSSSYHTLKEQYSKLLLRSAGLPGKMRFEGLSPEEKAAVADFRENVAPIFEGVLSDQKEKRGLDEETQDEGDEVGIDDMINPIVDFEGEVQYSRAMFSPESYHGMQPLADALTRHVGEHQLVAYGVLGKPAIDLLQHNVGIDMGSEKGQELDTQLKALAEFYIPAARGLFHSMQHKLITNTTIDPSELAGKINWTTIPSEYRLLTADDTESISKQISNYREGFGSLSGEEQRSLVKDIRDGNIMNPEAFLDESNPNSLIQYRATHNQRDADREARRINTVATTILRRGANNPQLQNEALARLFETLTNPQEVEDAKSTFETNDADIIREIVDSAVISSLRFDQRGLIDKLQIKEGVDDEGKPIDWSSTDVLSHDNPDIIGRSPVEDIVVAGKVVAKAGESITENDYIDYIKDLDWDVPIKFDPVITRASGTLATGKEPAKVTMGLSYYASNHGAMYPKGDAQLAQAARTTIAKYIKTLPDEEQTKILNNLLDILDEDQLPQYDYVKGKGLVIEGVDNSPPNQRWRNQSGRVQGTGETSFKAAQERQRGVALRFVSNLMDFSPVVEATSDDPPVLTQHLEERAANIKKFNMINSRYIGDSSPSEHVDIMQETEDETLKYIKDIMVEHPLAGHADFGSNYDHIFSNLKGFFDGTLKINGKEQYWADIGVRGDTFPDFAKRYLDREYGKLSGVSALVPGGSLQELPGEQKATSPLPSDEDEAEKEEDVDSIKPQQLAMEPFADPPIPFSPDPQAMDDWKSRAEAGVSSPPDKEPRIEPPGGG